MKFNPQNMDKVHGNYFIYNSFGPNKNRRHKKFKALFALPKKHDQTST